jgi:hypothetical protein
MGTENSYFRRVSAMLRKLSTRWRVALATLLLLALIAGPGVAVADNTAVQEGNSRIDEQINLWVTERHKIEKGKNVFDELLRQEGVGAPKYGAEEYWQRLIEYADPAGELRRQDPQKWELIDAYAYDYYVRYILPPAGSPEDELLQQWPASIGIQSGAYNRSEARNYAHRHVFNYNPAYRKFSADCTNFVSQCLRAGGIPMVDAWWRPWFDKDDWYYHRRGTDAFDSNNDDTWSWSWVKVRTLYDHTRARLGTQVSSAAELQVGDIAMLNLHDNDPANDHAMIVTGIDTEGRRLVTYHTTDTRDRRLDQIPGVQFYLRITY